jgi:arylsulfotransferase ASST
MHATSLLRNRTKLALLGAAAVITAAAGLAGGLWSAGGSQAAAAAVAVFPTPGAHVAAPTTQITLRGVPASQLGSIVVTGSKSGAHPGRVLSDSDGDGGSFLPTKPFTAGELVTVKTGLNVVGGTAGTFSFTVATPGGAIRVASPLKHNRVKGDVDRFASAPQLTPATMTVTTLPRRAEPGDLFVAPQTGPLQFGPEILGPYGGLIWFKTMPKGQSATDFRVQTYRGKPVLTWWQGTVNGGVGTGQDEIYNSSYQPVATVKAANGVRADLHEFQLTSQNTALVTAYFPVFIDASSQVKNGSKHELVFDSVIQEIDIPTSLVLYQWDSLDHVPLTASNQPAPKDPGHPWDYFHINSIQQAADGSLVVSGRNTWSVYDLSDQTGAINWTLGGKASTFKMGTDTSFAFQHDARLVGNQITIFDDGAGPPIVHKQSRAITLKLDTVHKTATLAGQDLHKPALLVEFEGNIQTQGNGDALVGWGGQPYVTEFNSKGQVVFDAHFVALNASYRAYRFPWNATPATKPSAAEHVSGAKATAYASWNGATAVARWRVLGGSTPTSLRTVASGRKAAFETSIKLPGAQTYVATQALDARGRVLGTSKAAKAS